MNKALTWFRELDLSRKIQFIIAMICSLAILIAVPVYAWFSYHNRIEAMTKVNEPPSLNLASGAEDPIQYFELKNIDVENPTTRIDDGKGGYYKDFVFSVEPGKITQYDLQLTHTTNIPFTYELLRLKKDENGTILYTSYENVTTKYSVLKDTDSDIKQEIELTDLNQSSTTDRVLGDEDMLNQYNRKNYNTDDNVNDFVKPLYSVSRNIIKNDLSVDGSDDRDYFTLRVHWKTSNSADDSTYWNYAFNNKETDIIYISAQASI